MGLNIFQATLVWIVIIGWLTLRFRARIARLFLRLHWPRWVLYFVSGFLFVMVEEYINCPPNGCSIIPHTWWVFLGLLIIHFTILKIFGVKRFFPAVLIYGFEGLAIELFFGSSSGAIWSNLLTTVIIIPWTIVTYSIMVLVSVTILQNRE